MEQSCSKLSLWFSSEGYWRVCWSPGTWAPKQGVEPLDVWDTGRRGQGNAAGQHESVGEESAERSHCRGEWPEGFKAGLEISSVRVLYCLHHSSCLQETRGKPRSVHCRLWQSILGICPEKEPQNTCPLPVEPAFILGKPWVLSEESLVNIYLCIHLYTLACFCIAVVGAVCPTPCSLQNSLTLLPTPIGQMWWRLTSSMGLALLFLLIYLHWGRKPFAEEK